MESGQLINLSTGTLDDSNIFFITNSGAKISYSYFIACIMSTMLAGWIIALNGIVIHTLLCRKFYQDVTDYFVSSLSIADLVTGIVMLYVTSYSLLQYQNIWECLVRFGLTYTVSHSSFSHILAITVDRYVKVMYPLRYFTIFTKKTVTIISASIWTCSILIGLLPLLGWNQEYMDKENRDTVCRFFGVLTNEYFIFNLVISIIPSVGTLCLYVCIIMTAVKKKEELKSLTEGVETVQSSFDERTWKLVKTVAIIVVFSNLCWTPGIICISLHISGRLDGLSVEARGDLITYSGLGVFLNSLINPLIYAVKIDEVKQRFKHLFCCYRQPAVRVRISSEHETVEMLNT